MASTKPPKVPFITVEEHWWSPTASSSLTEESIAKQGFPPNKVSQLQDVSADGPRLESMNANAIALQIVSHAPLAIINPGPETPSMTVDECTKSNNELHQRIVANPTTSSRFKGFARLPMHDPAAAASELHRSVTELGFVGALVDNTLLTPAKSTQTVFYDHPSYDAIWRVCTDLDVPFYLHPAYPPEGPQTPQYRWEQGSFSELTSLVLSTAGYGWHIDTGMHFLRLVGAGVFDRFPKLKFVLGHYGESLPFFLERVERILRMVQPEMKRDLLTVWNENVWISIAGFWGKAPTAAAFAVTKPERILFSVDWPFGSNEQGREYMDWLWGSGLVTPEQWEGVAFRNSLRLFGFKEEDLVRD